MEVAGWEGPFRPCAGRMAHSAWPKPSASPVGRAEAERPPVGLAWAECMPRWADWPLHPPFGLTVADWALFGQAKAK